MLSDLSSFAGSRLSLTSRRSWGMLKIMSWSRSLLKSLALEAVGSTINVGHGRCSMK